MTQLIAAGAGVDALTTTRWSALRDAVKSGDTALVVALDARRHGRVNRVFLAGTLLLIASYMGRLVLKTTGPWLRLATWMTGFV